MTGAVVCEPISWLRLERYQLGELPPGERAAIAGHLATCDRCRACLDRIQSPGQADLPPLPATRVAAGVGGGVGAAPPAARHRPARAWSTRWRLLGLATVGAAAALVLIVAGPRDAPRAPPGHRIHTKGGDVVLELVRERNGSAAYEPTSFAPLDRFKVLLTCPPPLRLFTDLAILQDDGIAFPGEPSAISCGNRVALPSAFRITGPGPAAVCVAVDGARPPPRERLRAARSFDAGVDSQVSCVQLGPAPMDRP
jgi:hypothetical protein